MDKPLLHGVCSQVRFLPQATHNLGPFRMSPHPSGQIWVQASRAVEHCKDAYTAYVKWRQTANHKTTSGKYSGLFLSSFAAVIHSADYLQCRVQSGTIILQVR